MRSQLKVERGTIVHYLKWLAVVLGVSALAVLLLLAL